MGVSVTAVHRLSSLDLCGISHSGGLVRTDVVGKEKAWIGRGLFSSLVLRPLRFPPVLTWLGFYNSPGRVTSRNSSPPPAVFFFTGRVGVVVTVEHLSSSQLERQDQSMIYGNICKMQSSGWCFQSWNRHCLTGDWKEKVLGGVYGVHAGIHAKGGARERGISLRPLRSALGKSEIWSGEDALLLFNISVTSNFATRRSLKQKVALQHISWAS